MSAFADAIARGIRSGFEKAWTDRCAGRADPEERCPMRLQDGCACYYRAYHEAPFWRRWRMEKPRRPSQDAVLKAMIGQQVEQELPLVFAKKRTALAAKEQNNAE
jgi:hypothetical protein